MLQAGAIGGSHPATLSERSSCRSNLVEHARVRKLHVLGDGRLASDACAHAYTQACRDKRARINTHAQHSWQEAACVPAAQPQCGGARWRLRTAVWAAGKLRAAGKLPGCAQPFGLQGSSGGSQQHHHHQPHSGISSSVKPCTHRECCSCCCRCRRSCRRGPCAPGRRSCRRSRAACAADGSRPAHPDARRRKPQTQPNRSRQRASGGRPVPSGRQERAHVPLHVLPLLCRSPPRRRPHPPLRLWERCLTCMIANCVKSHGVIIRFVAFDSRAANTSVFPQPPA